MSDSGWPGELSVLLLYNLDANWLLPEREEMVSEANGMVASIRSEGFRVEARAVDRPQLDAALEGVEPDDGLVVFNVCEGLPGMPRSEAAVTSALDELGLTYTGSPSHVLDSCWDKSRTKQRLWRRGVRTPRWRTFDSWDVDGWDRYPAIVKPRHEHCSVGVKPEAVVFDRESLVDRVSYVLDELEQPALVEEFIDGREFHVSVWGDGTLRALPVAEMDFSAFSEAPERLCTFDSKFTPGSRHWNEINVVLPAPLDEEAQRELVRTSVAAYRAVGCRDYARIDLRQDRTGFTVLDVNPNCDLSADTSTAAAAELALGSFGAFLGDIVRLAATRRSHASDGAPCPAVLRC
jgi:D-alanine-D-alanine ligase